MPLAVLPESASVGILIFRQSSQGAETFRDLFEHWRTMRVRNEVVYAQGARIGARICNPQHLVRIHIHHRIGIEVPNTGYTLLDIELKRGAPLPDIHTPAGVAHHRARQFVWFVIHRKFNGYLVTEFIYDNSIALRGIFPLDTDPDPTAVVHGTYDQRLGRRIRVCRSRNRLRQHLHLESRGFVPEFRSRIHDRACSRNLHGIDSRVRSVARSGRQYSDRCEDHGQY